jgi:predicted transcriptional regulator
MNALWPLGEATVRQVRDTLRPTRPRAYTTIMTILDRLSHKGIVERRKVGRAWVYRANVSADEARAHAVAQVVDGFFGGSTGALASHLSAQSPAANLQTKPVSLASSPIESISAGGNHERQRPATSAAVPATESVAETAEPANLDASLL